MKTSNQPSRRDVKPDASAPWWRFGHVWLVIAGPAVVVVASFVTLYLALNSPNTVLDETVHARDASQAPAMQARNHAATGVVPVKPVKP
jgi:hypothetical protein